MEEVVVEVEVGMMAEVVADGILVEEEVVVRTLKLKRIFHNCNCYHFQVVDGIQVAEEVEVSAVILDANVLSLDKLVLKSDLN